MNHDDEFYPRPGAGAGTTVKAKAESESDDIWDDDGPSDLQYDRSISERNWKRLQETHGVLGYKEGVVEGKDESLQAGFNVGFSEGAIIGHELGRLRGIISTMLAFSQLPDNRDLNALQDRIPALKNLHNDIHSVGLEKLFTKSYFSSSSSTQQQSSRKEECGRENCCAKERPEEGSVAVKEGLCKDVDGSHPQNIVKMYRERVEQEIDTILR